MRQIVQRTYRVKSDDKDRVKSLKREGESNYEMLERLGEHIRDMDLDSISGKITHMRLDFPPWVFELLKKRSEETGVSMIQIIRMAAGRIKERDG